MASKLTRSEGSIRIWSLLGSGDTARIEALLELYQELLPQYAHYVPRMRRRTEWGRQHRPGQLVHYWLLEVDGRPAAFHMFRYVRERHVGLTQAMAVGAAYRGVCVGGQQLSLYLLSAGLEQIAADAQEYGDEQPFGLAGEVEPSRLMDHYMSHGFLELPLAYVKPVFPVEQPGSAHSEEIALCHFVPMFLGILPNRARGIPYYTSDLIGDFALAFLLDHYGLPIEHRQVQSVLDSIPAVFRKKESSPQENKPLPCPKRPVTREFQTIGAQVSS